MKKGDTLRSCLGCRETFEKKNLLRFVLSPENEVVLDFYWKLPGRGGYLCPRINCIEKALKGNAFKRAFKRDVKIPEAEELIEIFTLRCTEKIASLLSMAIRSRKVSLGSEAVEGDVKRDALSLLLLSKELSHTARMKWDRKMVAKGINIGNIPSSEAINTVLSGRKVVAIKDQGMATALKVEIDKLEKISTDLI